MKFLTNPLSRLHLAKNTLVGTVMVAFSYLHLTADYSRYEEPIVDWKAGKIFWESLHWGKEWLAYNEQAWKLFFSSIDVAIFFILEAITFLLFSYICCKHEPERFFRQAWRWYSYYFLIRLIGEVYACLFGVSINVKYIAFGLFFVTCCIILFFWLYYKKPQERTNTPKLP